MFNEVIFSEDLIFNSWIFLITMVKNFHKITYVLDVQIDFFNILGLHVSRLQLYELKL